MKKITRSPIVTLVTLFALALSLCSGILTTDVARAQTNGETSTKKTTSAVAHYAVDLTRLAREGKLEMAKGHESQLQPIVQILSRAQQNNPVLVTDDAITSKAVVESLAQRIATGNVPANLRGFRVYSASAAALLDGLKTAGDLEVRVKAWLAEASSDRGNSILYIDELDQ